MAATAMPDEPMREPNADPILALSTPGKEATGDEVPAATSVECQVCFDTVQLDEAMTQICHESCNGAVCMHCMSSYLDSCAGAAPRGVLSRLKCPLCIQPLNMVRVMNKASKSAETVAAAAQAIRNHEYHFRNRVEGSCELLCPECHEPSVLLQDPPALGAAIDMKTDHTEWPSELLTCPPDNVADLVSECNQYCSHNKTARELLSSLERLVGVDDYLIFARELNNHIFDPERRVALFLATAKLDPYLYTTCCDADVCFACKRQGHHIEESCSENLPDMEDLAQCPRCDLMLVKGDGCSTITCFCGEIFEWEHQVTMYELKIRTTAVLATHRRAFQAVAAFLKVQVARSKFADLVIARIPESVLAYRMARMTPFLSSAPWSTSVRSCLQRWTTRRRNLKQSMAAHRLWYQHFVVRGIAARAQQARLARLTTAMSQPMSTWMTAFKAMVGRAVARRRFARVLHDVPDATKRLVEKKATREVDAPLEPVDDCELSEGAATCAGALA